MLTNKLLMLYFQAEYFEKIISDNQINSNNWILKYCGKVVWVHSDNNGLRCFEQIQQSMRRQSRIADIKIVLWNILLMFVRKKTAYNTADNKTSADCIMISADQKAYILFSYTERQIKRICKDDTYICGYQLLKKHHYFDYIDPSVIRIESKTIYERFLRNREISEKKKYLYVLEKYRDYYKNTEPVSKLTINRIFADNDISLKKNCFINNSEIMEKVIPCFCQHGDLSAQNVFYDDELYVIDYEHVGIYPFFFDLFAYIWADRLNDGSLYLFNDIIDPTTEIGLLMKDIFMLFGLEYSHKHIIDYFFVGIVLLNSTYSKRIALAVGSEDRRFNRKCHSATNNFVKEYM